MSVTSNINHSTLQIVDELQQNITSLVDLSNLFVKIAHRGDLDEEDPQPFGNIDLKMFKTAVKDSNAVPTILTKSGPLHAPKFVPENEAEADHKGVFSWTKFGRSPAHNSQPNIFEFQFVSPTWSWTQ